MSFKLVAALWITPDFTEVEAGRREAPRIDHSRLDYRKLASFLEELFPFGPRPSIQVANDTIDQVTIHMRQVPGAPAQPTMRCEDFGQVLLSRAKTQKSTVVNVRSDWQRLHYLKDRDSAPPPMVIPFVATFEDFEDAMIWMSNTRPSLGLPPFDILKSMEDRRAQKEMEGNLSQEALAKLEVIFGTPFSPPALLDRMAWDNPPSYARS